MYPERLDRAHETLGQFTERLAPARTVDNYTELLDELFLIRNPRFKFAKPSPEEHAAFRAEHTGLPAASLAQGGEWFFFPWNKTLAHYLPEDEHNEVRTARNKNIVTKDEQDALYGLRVAYAGLSVGSHGALTFALLGGGKRVKIADPDTVSPSNLNRIRYDFLAVGSKKTDLARDYLYQLNPYGEIGIFDAGVSAENIDDFLSDIDVLVEETDNLEMKIFLRLKAREKKIPVLMATDNGHNVIVDVERFDEDPTMPLFGGAIGDITIDEFRSFPPQELPRLATKIAGPRLVVERMLASLPEVGKTLYSWPQLGSAATLAGVTISYLLSRVALKQPLASGKREVNLDAIFDPDYMSAKSIAHRDGVRESFLQALSLS